MVAHYLRQLKPHRSKQIKVYCCKSITSSIAAIISRPGMTETCESWRNRHVFQDLCGDVYDGKVWQDFKTSGFFTERHSYAECGLVRTL